LHYRGVVEWGLKAADVLALLEHARRWIRPDSPFVGAPRGMRSVTCVEPRLEAEVSYAEIVEGGAGAELASPRQAGDDDVAVRENNAAPTREAVTDACSRTKAGARVRLRTP
jgi:hypothetical protein